jgi:GNAT superfamily N-acetyltransferase
MIGRLKGQIIDKHLIETEEGPVGLWEQCQAYDATHVPTALLCKVEDYINNETFYESEQAVLDHAERIVFVEAVVVHPQYRGRSLGLRIVDEFLKRNLLLERTVVLLQPGPIGEVREGISATEASDSITRHW